jgi:hypothetical protein
MELNETAQIEKAAMQLWKTEKLNFQAKEHASLLTIVLLHGILVSTVL